ncbi:flagellar basal body rod protein FlgC [Roseicitreum antarcticum]|uniref:Flagellar basal body rod protein FlgB n=1 Tax=Roseicitreum antarcticum TaxID=564137 RepID=A0A1H3A247_9RHOB|nr:flagellar basal body rod protein FlgC [Roseicitreum antarcticum]SDX23706.1 flagellar basal-body rod protein FlgC [Roseicitreum antarcticum]
MSNLSQTLGVSASGMQAQAQRLRHVSENIANADTPGYRRKTVAFDAVVAPAPGSPIMVRPGEVQLDQRALPQIYEPGHVLADETGHYFGSNVDPVIEIADAREAQRSYEANLKMFDQAKQMQQSLIEFLRR